MISALRMNMKCISNHEKNLPYIHFSIALAEAAFDYGRNIGIAFQLVDDILDFEAREEEIDDQAHRICKI